MAVGAGKEGGYCVAVDLGASNCRLFAGRISDGRLELKPVDGFPTPSAFDTVSGYQCWGIEGIVSNIENALVRYAANTPIISVGVDGWGVDFLLLNSDFRRVGKPVGYRDKRTDGMMDLVQACIPAGEIYRRTGIQFQRYNSLYQLRAIAEFEPKWIDAAEHLLMIPDYLHFRLCGVLSNEYTNATTTQMLSLTGEWDHGLLEAGGLRRILMKTPVPAGSVLGRVKIGDDRAKVIAPATHDTASAVAGTPLSDSDEAYISSGTWSLMGIESASPIASKEAMRMNFANEGGLDRRYRVLKNLTGMWPFQRICEEHHQNNLSSLVTEAGTVEPWCSLINPDDLYFLNPPSMAEAIRTYCRDTGQPEPLTLAQLARCTFDSLALLYGSVKTELEALREKNLTRIRIIDGGCKNGLLNQLCADACQVPVIVGPVEASTVGNLVAQMIALGAIDNLDVAREIVRASFPMEGYQPRGTIPIEVYRRFRQLTNMKYQERMQCA